MPLAWNELLGGIGGSMARATQTEKAWSRGYYCAVAALLNETGVADTHVKSLFEQGGSPELADADDQELFREHGLMPPNL